MGPEVRILYYDCLVSFEIITKHETIAAEIPGIRVDEINM